MSQLNYLQSRQVVKSAAMSALPGTLVKDLLDPIKVDGFDRYKLSAEGYDCRHWVTEVILLWRRNGLIGQRDEALEALKSACDKN